MNIQKISLSLGEKVNLEQWLGPLYKFSSLEPRFYLEAETTKETYKEDLGRMQEELYSILQSYIKYIIAAKKVQLNGK